MDDKVPSSNIGARRSTQPLGIHGEVVQIVYAILCIVGTTLPLTQFLPWFAGHGLNLPLFFTSATATPIAAFGWSDLVVSGVVVVIFVLAEGRRLGMRHAWASLLGLVVGVSLALPLFLLLRQRHLAAMGPNTSMERACDR